VIDARARSALERASPGEVAFDVPMARHTSLRVGGPADALATPADRQQLIAMLDLCREHHLPYLLLGAGFNTLVCDEGVDGVVVKLSQFRTLEQSGDDAVYAEAGVTHASLTRFCVDRGLSGLEFGAGIPGVVGVWVAMNAGTSEREVEAAVREVELLTPGSRTCERVPRTALRFAYRSFESLAPGTVVVAALFQVRKLAPIVVRAEVERLLELRAGTQPLNVPSCGSVWKNPKGDYAGRLIEQVGLKGVREGGAQISPVHANFIANTGGATARDVLQLMERTRETVLRAAGVSLEPEVKIIRRASKPVVRRSC
jgi:UDP-N-acetylmuramate dehydrogenase